MIRISNIPETEYDNENGYFIKNYPDIINKINEKDILKVRFKTISVPNELNKDLKAYIYTNKKLIKIIQEYESKNKDLTFININDDYKKYISFGFNNQENMSMNINILIPDNNSDRIDDKIIHSNKNYNLYVTFNINKYYQDLINSDLRKDKIKEHFIKSINDVLNFEKQVPKKQSTKIVKKNKVEESESEDSDEEVNKIVKKTKKTTIKKCK